MDTNGTNPTIPAFHIGRTDVIQGASGDTTQSQLDSLISGSFTADGTITIKLKIQTPMAMTATGAPNFTVTLLPGAILSTVKISTAQLIGVAGNGLNVFTDQDTNNAGVQTYTLKGNAFCRPNLPPVPFMTATPQSGVAPLTVNFNASGSSDPDTDAPADTIASYTFNFGDGSAPVTQASPLISHTYISNGDYPARLTVTDSRGLASISFFQLLISVDSTFNKAVSHKVHAAAGPFDINLPLTGGVVGSECRSGGANQDYTIIYTFDRNLSGAGSASATVSHGVGGGTGSVSSQTFGPLANQYTVNVTNVSNAQHLSVTLDGVFDIAGALINNSLARMDMLLGDTNGNGAVNNSDITQTKGQSGTVPSATTFRTDVTANGVINNSDITTVKGKSGTGLP